MRLAFLALLVVGCTESRSPSADAAVLSVSASSVAPAESAAPAPSDAATAATTPKLADCFEPSRITQLGTIKNEVVWEGDVVSDGTKRFDPETLLDEVAPPARMSSPTNDFLLTGERVEQHRTSLVAGARRLGRLADDERFSRVEEGRWVVIVSGEGDVTVHLVDGLTGKRDPRAYVAAHGDLVAFADSSMGVTVTNRVTHATVLKDMAVCAAGGTWSWSLSSRFLWCESNRGGATGYDLKSGKAFAVGQSAFTSPDESYLVRVPGVGWGSNLISEDHVEWATASGRTAIVTTDVPHATTDQTMALASTVPVAFCGDGKLFAITTRRDLVVYRGADAKRLAAARAMSGGALAFSRSGRWLLYKRAGAATVYRLDP